MIAVHASASGLISTGDYAPGHAASDAAASAGGSSKGARIRNTNHTGLYGSMQIWLLEVCYGRVITGESVLKSSAKNCS